MNKPLVIVIVGPTASGKTSLAVKIAKLLDGEIISADSMQIYKGMNIATAKPTAEEQDGIRHHLIDICDPDETFSVARFRDMALDAIKDILRRGKQPIIAGGTGLYIDTVVNNTVFLDYEKSDIRERLMQRVSENGIEELMTELEQIDSETASQLHLNDTKRIVRALEVYYSTGKTISEQRAVSNLKESDYDFCIIGLNARNRQVLYDRINQRVVSMINDGIIRETEEFYTNDYSSTAKQAIGYKELKPYLDDEISLHEAVENLKMQTRRYAKRQLTWFRKNENINWIYIDDLKKSLLDDALEIIHTFEGNAYD
ncbi:MAG: tRNA (adenosine(37)-N6)-dimethylallyltransferase MiaA [Faecalibacterium sp.]|nr:tRNA (adenosine(37)-N6)-dimethylallyltransferase MiaA [Ruminococcus sp.]MCM1391748.1 tRNA (adenosine(37)-N6)-dimethylallyltransferase MiaA [Ruminococcus sp.]MCM1485028.1 tRNA (adenosine(37)-N6)-dimethylallyltransferase MiaA [Faecalibacterium sp.]